MTVVVGGKSKVISTSHANFKTVYRLVSSGRWKDAANYLSLGDIAKNVTRGAKAILKKAGIGPKDDRLRQKINHELKAGRDLEQFKPFFKRCSANPNPKSVDMLFDFLKYIRAPIQSDGSILIYKGVREDWTDVHTGTFDNHPGQSPSMKREDCEYNPHVGCGRGLHVGSISFARGYGSRLVVVKVDPANVVSVPNECSQQKMRVCTYKVIKEISTELSPEQIAQDKAFDVGN